MAIPRVTYPGMTMFTHTATTRLIRRPHFPTPRWRPILIAGAAVGILLIASTWGHLAVLPATGSQSVGRERIVLLDTDRSELHTEELSDHRSVPVELWYPAKAETGHPASYLEDLSTIADGLVASGTLSRFEALGLSLVRTEVRADAEVLGGDHPVVVLSPGNETNVGFYASIAEELASHGYLVIGVDHAYQVAATATSGGTVAVYDSAADAEDPALGIAAKIDERVADVRFVLDSLQSGEGPLAGFASSADLDRLGIVGHSNGGLTAFEVCRVDPRVDACLNMDGQAAGGLLGHSPDSQPPSAPFMFLTKETVIHPAIDQRLEGAASAVRAVVPDAAHDSFTDGPLFRPGLNPGATTSQRLMTTIRSTTLAFFNQWLGEGATRPYDQLTAPADIYINVYPLGGRDPIPLAEQNGR
jgi:dienelactone hydrolase